MDRKKINKVIKTYLADLSQSVKIDKAILFGSGALGKLGKDGDIDLLILSAGFKMMNVLDRFDLLYKARIDPLTQSTPMDIFGLTPDEYKKANRYSITGEIKEKGRVIAV